MEKSEGFDLEVPETESARRIDYDPVEGIDYLIDLYALSGVARDASVDDINRTINRKLLEYHPDRLQGLAAEFIEKGERQARLLNRAKHVLLDDSRRQIYDELLNNWDGPLSETGIPVITMDRYRQATLALSTPEEIETEIANKRQKLELLISYDPDKITRLEDLLLETLDDTAKPYFRQELENTLLDHDRILAIEEAERLELLGIDVSTRGYSASLDYPDKLVGELGAAREAALDALLKLSDPTNVERLALLTGESLASESPIVPSGGDLEVSLPTYFDDQSEKIVELAKQREEILKKRLDIFEPDYPLPEFQTEAYPRVMLGVEQTENIFWLGFNYTYDADSDKFDAASFDYGQELAKLLEDGNYAEVIEQGYNVITIKIPEQIEIKTAINNALGKYLSHFGVDKTN